MALTQILMALSEIELGTNAWVLGNKVYLMDRYRNLGVAYLLSMAFTRNRYHIHI